MPRSYSIVNNNNRKNKIGLTEMLRADDGGKEKTVDIFFFLKSRMSGDDNRVMFCI